jgi:glycosyltransferase involved in cell wall biosynthesis
VVYHQFLLSKLLGGAGLVALEIARSLQESGRNAQVWLPEPGPALAKAKELGLQVQFYRRPLLENGWKPLAAAANLWVCWRLRKFGPGIVHVHSPHLYGLLQWGLSRNGFRTVVHVHIEEEEGGLRWAFQRPPHLIITCARFLVPQVRKALPPAARDRQRIVAIPNAVDTDRFRPGDRREHKIRLGLDQDEPFALMLANLAPHKGQETAIRAAAELKRRGKRCQLWLAGSERDSGRYTAALKEIIAREGVCDCVKLVGHRDDAPELLRAANVLLLPSKQEGLPLCILEAQASKVPVLAAPTSGVPEVIEDGVTGFLISPDDARGYADRIDSLLADPAASDRLAEEAYSRVLGEYGWRTYLASVLHHYDELLSPGRASDGRHVKSAG